MLESGWLIDRIIRGVLQRFVGKSCSGMRYYFPGHAAGAADIKDTGRGFAVVGCRSVRILGFRVERWTG